MEFVKRYFDRIKATTTSLKELLFGFESPRQIALSVTFGFFLGIFPVVGITTAMCVLAIFSFRLNYLATIGTNFLVSPIQVALLYPFWRAGQLLRLNGTPVDTNIEIPTVGFSTLSANWSHYSLWFLGAVLAWALFSLLGGLLFYFILRKLQLQRSRK